MLYVAIILFLISVFAFIKFSLLQQNPSVHTQDRPDHLLESVKPGQNTAQAIRTNMQTKRNIKVQFGANVAAETAIAGIKLSTGAEEASLYKDSTQERFNAALKVETAAANTAQKEHQLRERLIDLALVQGLDIETYLEVSKKKELDALEVQRIEDEAMIALRTNFVYQLADYQKLGLIRGQLSAAYILRDSLRHQPDELKQVNKDIRTLERSANAQRKRLLPARPQTDVRGSDEDAEY